MQPTTGWYSGRDVDDCVYDNMVDAAYGHYCPHCGNHIKRECAKRCPHCYKAIDWDMCDGYETTDWLVGDWTYNRRTGEYSPDKTGQFAGLYDSNDNELAIVWSKTIRYGHLGSQCIPGQVHAETDDPSEPPDGVDVQTAIPGLLTPAQLWRDDNVYAYYGLPDDCIRRDDD